MNNLSPKDLETLKEKGITTQQLAEEVEMLRVGFPFLKLYAPATTSEGIKKLTPEMKDQAVRLWDEYLGSGKASVIKMVPASGAASRMFKDLYTFLNSDSSVPRQPSVIEFFDKVEEFPFFRRLNLRCIQLYGLSIDSLVKSGRYKDVVNALLKQNGLNYGNLPKGLLGFHRVPGSNRVAMEEHLAEAAQYAAIKGKDAHVHYTVSEEHIPYFKVKLEEIKAYMEHLYGVVLHVTLSVQKPSTDTVATLPDGSLYRENGTLFFRPGGHGALIRNLNDLDADVVFIKNIDNVLPESTREETIKWKKILAGLLMAVKTELDKYCRKLASPADVSDGDLAEMVKFLRETLCVTHDNFEAMSRAEKIAYLQTKFNRPLRVCGMVRNEGEPGGGPFLVYSPDGTVQPQILESSQIDKNNPEAVRMLKESTHFNPVDLVVALKNYKGKKFDLPSYVDKATGFISQKSREGVEINALELPGLWNGAMADWNTIFVEVPATTFSPVKTVNDLLRPAHQD